MGVSLERVQFKFASIIGELCSEPDVLSQFAVWVDLRLAEYKLKGSISLDCSGETPDPVWLKGIKSAILAKELALRSLPRLGGFNRRKAPPHPLKPPSSRASTVSRDNSDIGHPHLSSTPVSTRPATESRLSPIVIKEEPDEIYPVSLHMHNPDSRKHMITSDSDSEPGGAKRLRYSATEPSSEDVPANESLMSIIGLNDSETGDKTDTTATHEEIVSREIDMLVSQSLSESAAQETDRTELELSDQSFAAMSTSSASVHVPNRLGQGDNQNDASRVHPGRTMTRERSMNPTYRRNLHMDRLRHVDRRMRCRINTFESWLQADPHEESRAIEDIPPVELDKYLAEFFLTVKTLSGEDYTYSSMSSIRGSLERYLKENGYGVSILLSPLFCLSRKAWRDKWVTVAKRLRERK